MPEKIVSGVHPVIKRKEGMYVPDGGFYLDPKRAAEHAVITHAHADHAVGGSENVYCTALTADLMKLRFGNRAAKRFHIIDENGQFAINGIRCRFFPAGHMAGSVMVMIYSNDNRILFTGDWNDSSCGHLAPCSFPQTDILITETTFASPKTIHPEISSEICKITRAEMPIVAGAYRFGKAQRINFLIHKYAPKLSVYIHRDIVPVHKLYSAHGFQTGQWLPFSKKHFSREKSAVYIVPPHVLPSFYGTKNIATTFVTGWTHRNPLCSFLTNISDHADWNSLLRMVEKTKPHTIYTMHGSGKHLQTYFFASGIHVFELK